MIGRTEFRTVDEDMKEFYENEADNVISSMAEEAEEAAETAETGAEEAEQAPEEAAENAEPAEDAGAEPAAEEKKEDSETGKKAVKKDPKDQKIEELEDRLKRNLAEFDNFRKRTDKEKASMYVIGARDVIEKILPVIDNFERGLASIPEEEKGGAIASGMEMIYKQLMKILEDLGVKPIEAVGKVFDPNYHNAVMQVESEEYESGVVAQEFIKGYMYHDTVVRHSMVGVVQ